MATSPDTLSPGGINWETAMENAVRFLEPVTPYGKKFMVQSTEMAGVHASMAQAWIAYAREITMHARATQ